MSRNNEPSDADLVAWVLAGDRDAFGCLYDRYARLVRAVVYRVGNDAPVVNDLAQEVFPAGLPKPRSTETAGPVRSMGGRHRPSRGA